MKDEEVIRGVEAIRVAVDAGELKEPNFQLPPYFDRVVSNYDAGLSVYKTPRGRSVYATKAFSKGDRVESCPLLVFPRNEATGNKTTMQRYVWGYRGGYAIALGTLGSLANHASGYKAKERNLDTEIDYEHGLLVFTALRDIESGEELMVCYSDNYPMGEGLGDLSTLLGELNTAVISDFNNRKVDWFDALRDEIKDCPKSKAKQLILEKISLLKRKEI